MKPPVFLPLLLLTTLGMDAHAGVTGQCVYEGKKLVFVDAYAALAPDPFEEKLKVPMLWFTTVALDRAALAKADSDEIDDAVTEQTMDLHSVKLELRLDAAGTVVEGLQFYQPPGSNRSVSGNDVGELKLKAPVGARASGHFALTDDEDLKCDVEFDLPIAGKGPPAPAAKPWGTALPKGGGEPGAVYMAMHKATLAGDIDAMLKLASKEQGDQMRKARSEPDFPKMLELIKLLEPAQVSVVSGRADDTRAELAIAGKDSDGATITGEVKLIREGGAWRIAKVSTKSKAGQ